MNNGGLTLEEGSPPKNPALQTRPKVRSTPLPTIKDLPDFCCLLSKIFGGVTWLVMQCKCSFSLEMLMELEQANTPKNLIKKIILLVFSRGKLFMRKYIMEQENTLKKTFFLNPGG